MGQKLMGRNSGLLTADEAAKILGTYAARVHQYTQEGVLRARYEGNRNRRLFRSEEVYALKEAKESGLDLPTLCTRALQAYALSHALEQRLERVEAVLGLDVPILSYDEESVMAEYLRAQDLAANPIQEPVAITDFIKALLGIHEEFLELVQRYTHDQEPWKIFLLAARHLRENCPVARMLADDEMSSAQLELQVARRVFSRTAFIFVCSRNGKQAAHTTFPETEPDIHERILQHQFIPGHKGPGIH